MLQHTAEHDFRIDEVLRAAKADHADLGAVRWEAFCLFLTLPTRTCPEFRGHYRWRIHESGVS